MQDVCNVINDAVDDAAADCAGEDDVVMIVTVVLVRWCCGLPAFLQR